MPIAKLEARVVAPNVLKGNNIKSDYTGIPSVVFMIPALARVGLLEGEAREQGLDFACKVTDMPGWFTTRRVGETHAAGYVMKHVARHAGVMGWLVLLPPTSREPLPTLAGGNRPFFSKIARAFDLPVIGHAL